MTGTKFFLSHHEKKTNNMIYFNLKLTVTKKLHFKHHVCFTMTYHQTILHMCDLTKFVAAIVATLFVKNSHPRTINPNFMEKYPFI